MWRNLGSQAWRRLFTGDRLAELSQTSLYSSSHVLWGWHGRWLSPPSVFHRVVFPHFECPQVAWTLSREEPRCRCVGARRQRAGSGSWPAPSGTVTGHRGRLSSRSGCAIPGATLKEASKPRSGATTSPETRNWTRLGGFCLRQTWAFPAVTSFRYKTSPASSGAHSLSLHLPQSLHS